LKFLARFQRLERARARTAEAHASEAERFSALESAAPLPEVRPPQSGRFALPDAPLELDRAADAQPFVRCEACGRDSQRGTMRCACGAPLDTPEVAEFNALLWADHQARQREERADHQQALARELAEAERLAAGRRALGESLARRVAEQERLADPPVRKWGWPVVLGVVGYFLFRFGPRLHSLLLFALGVAALAAVGLWWRQRRPPGP